MTSRDLSCFAADYAEARAKFLGAAEAAGALLARYENPNKGPHGEDLFLDTAWLGSKDAQKVLAIVSGTHGPKGFCGSGCQVDWLSNFGAPPHRDRLLILTWFDDALGSRGETLASGWFGDSVTNHQLGTASASAQQGFVADCWKVVLGEKLVAGTLEFGCYPLPTTHEALREEHWHYVNGFAWDHPATRQAKAKIMRAFYPDKDDWKEMVLFRSRQVLRQAITGLSSC